MWVCPPSEEAGASHPGSVQKLREKALAVDCVSSHRELGFPPLRSDSHQEQAEATGGTALTHRHGAVWMSACSTFHAKNARRGLAALVFQGDG